MSNEKDWALTSDQVKDLGMRMGFAVLNEGAETYAIRCRYASGSINPRVEALIWKDGKFVDLPEDKIPLEVRERWDRM